MPGYYGDPTNGGQCTGKSFCWEEKKKKLRFM